MSIKITVPWKIHLPAMRTRTTGGRTWWNRRPFKDTRSAPERSVMMEATDLDHLGALHHVLEGRTTKKKRKRA